MAHARRAALAPGVQSREFIDTPENFSTSL
jgi:hypothetical protein